MLNIRTLAILSLATAALPSAAIAHWAYTGAMTQSEIRDTIIGNSLTGKTAEGSTYTEYYSPDGVIRGTATEGGRYEGRWSIRDDDAMCWAYAPDFAVVGCVLLIREGDTVNFQLIDGTTEPPATLLPGNPEGL